jgi:hypothetical protein
VSDVLLYVGIALVATGLFLALCLRVLGPGPGRHRRARSGERKEYW